MHKDEVIAILKAHLEEFENLGVKSLALFGSVVRGQAGPNSDVDLLIEFEPAKVPEGFAFFGHQERLRELLQSLLGQPVDLADPRLLKPRIQEHILSQAVSILPATEDLREKVEMSGKDWRVYVEDMLDALALIDRSTRNLTPDAFCADVDKVAAVERRIMIVGEAANRMLKEAPEVTRRYPQIPWSEMYSMRNILIHGYYRVDLEKVWFVVQNGSAYQEQLHELLEREGRL